ncbi:MAG: winged helix-turn-helix domain-containing protein [Dokdonella sp.]|uniref:winged helix-turn-helix domain-containing protein n=1 Tax=Dokdonella sp. TaxID=2291710 RepID=UPI003F7D5D31
MNLHVSPQRATDQLLTQPNLRLRVGDHVVDVGALRVVTRPELPRLTGKAVAVLIELVRHAGATVTRDELLDRVWTGRLTTPDVLNQAIKELRRAFGDDRKPPQYIETIPKVGYRLVATVLVLDGPAGGVFVEAPDDAAGSDVVGGAPIPAALPLLQPQAPRSALLLAAAIAALAALAGALAWWLAPSARPTWRVEDVHALTSDPGSEYRPHLSPDGTRVAFSVFDPESRFERLVVRSVEPSRTIRLTSTGTAIEGLPMWSPDGTRIAFERLGVGYCEMFVVPSLGGNERRIGPCQDYNFNLFDWTPDSRSLIFAVRPDPAQRALALALWNLDSGETHRLDYARSADDEDIDAHYSPDGRLIAFRRGLSPYSDIWVMRADGSDVHRVTQVSASIRGHAWTSDSRSIVFSSTWSGSPAMYVVDVDSGELQPLGVGKAQFPHASRSGDMVVYELTRTQDRLKLLPIGDAAGMRVLSPSTGSDYAPALSPDASRVVFSSDRSGQLQLWLHDLAAKTTVQLTDDVAKPVLFARWSIDGDRVVAVQREGARRRLVEIDLASHRQRVLSRPDDVVMFGDYDVEPESYLVAVHGAGRSSKLLRIEHAGTPQEARSVLVEGVEQAQVDAQARALYYTAAGVPGLMRRELDGGAERLVTRAIGPDLGSGWRVVDGHIWYFAELGIRSAALHELDPATGADRLVTRLDLLIGDVSFSVMPGGDAILFAPVDIEDTDIGALRLVRTDRR